jgi:Domain of unknown function (DUF4265)
MNSRYKPGDYEARHNEPVWRNRANFVIAADIASSAEKQEWEQLWARKLSDTRFEICCIPFFAYDLALGDEVETDANYVLRRVVKPSGRATFRVWFGNSMDSSDRNRVMEFIQRERCEYEWSSENLLAIDAPTTETAKALAVALEALQQSGQVTFETGRIA